MPSPPASQTTASETAASGARWRLLFPILLLALFGAASAARAQISPGPLAKAHENLEGVTNCLKCHGVGKNVVDDRCLDCHKAIAYLRDNHRGLHGLEGASDCTRCHKDHGGRDFEIVHWEPGEPEKFDHARAGYVLDGKHAELECAKCHKPELRTGPVPAMVEGGLSAKSFLGLETACFACHSDPHAGRLGNECTSCHTTNRWSEVATTFDHSKTRYPLVGAHATVACEKCHVAGYDKTQMPAFASCTDCHADPHQGQATLAGVKVDCDRCHRLQGFKPSTFTAAAHRDTKYPLKGKHASVACRDCHGDGTRTADAGAVESRFRFHPAAAKCMDCHDQVHGTQLSARADKGACESCHVVEGFTPTTFQVADHQKTDFPLEGRHEEAKCAACHGPDRPLLPAIAPTKAVGKAGVQLTFDSAKCEDCHRDPHQGRFSAGTELGGAKGCVTCHDVDSFSTPKIDAAEHAKYGFKLEGAHGAVPCFECHKEMKRKPSSSLKLAPASVMTFEHDGRKCVDCHQDPHGGQFGVRADAGACESCHGVDAWKPADRFDHDKNARFPLQGAHAKVACDKCHFNGPRTDGTEGVIYRPIVPHRCEDCHGTKQMAPLDGSG